MFRSFLFPAALLLFVACAEQEQRGPVSSVTAIAPSRVSVDQLIYEGRLMVATPRVVDLNTLPAPREVPLKKAFEYVQVQNNRSRIFRASEGAIPGSLKVVTPGKHGAKLPVRKPAKPVATSFVQPEPVPALPTRIKDVAIHDIQYLTVDQGLTSSYIRTILEDRFGNLWIATSFGVSKYDGQYFTHYKEKTGLVDEMVLSMLEDSRGHLWFGTGKGVSCYDGQRFLTFGAEEGFADCKVRRILEDTHGDIWFGTDAGVIRYDLNIDGGTFFHYSTEQGLIHDNILSMEEDDRGFLWFGSDQGLTRFDGFNFTHFTDQTGLTSNLILALYNDSQGNLWLGMDNGLSRYNDQQFVHYGATADHLGNGVTSILEDKRGQIWLGTQDGLLRYAFSREEGELEALTVGEGLSSNRIRCLLEDSQGNLWIGTGGGGVIRYKDAGFHHLTVEAGLIDNGVVCILEDGRGNIWFGTDRGLSQYDGKQFRQLTTANGLIDENVQVLLEDSRGYLWIGTQGGICRFDGSNFVYYTTDQGLPDNLVLSAMEDKRGHLWIGTREGLCRFVPDGKKGKMFQYFAGEGLINHYVQDILEDRQGRIWLGTDQGLARFMNRSDSTFFRHLTMEEGLIDNDVITVMEDYQGYLWLGTTAGISRFHPDSLELGFIHFTTEDGLSDNQVWSLQEDRDRNIWASTEKGITLIRPTARQLGGQEKEGRKGGYEIFSFGRRDGLKRLDFQRNSVCLDQQNRIWWGAEGATMLDLTQFKLANEPPRSLVLTNLRVNQQFVDYRRISEVDSMDFDQRLAAAFDSVAPYHNYPLGLRLPHDMDHLTFHFSAIHWARPREISYEYYLEGLEDTWNRRSAEPRADYRNLSSGTYTFHLRARGDAAEWSEPFSYTFTVLPPWYRTWWAIVFYGIVALGAGFQGIRILKNRWVLQDRLLQERKESERLKELSDRLQELDGLKSRLYTNLTHEFRTPLTVIIGMAEQIKEDPDRFLGEGVELIERNGQQLLQLINQLLDLSKLKNKSFRLQLQEGNIIPHLHHITESFQVFAARKQLKLTFASEEKRVVMNYDPLQVEQIMINLISNAIKFTLPYGSIAVWVGREADELLIRVTDTGIGIAEKNIPHVFDRFYQVDSEITRAGEGTGIGLAHTQELIQLMEGSVKVESQLEVGTTFTVSLPIQVGALVKPEAPESETAGGLSPDLVHPAVPGLSLKDRSASVERHRMKGVVLPKILIIEDNPDTATYIAGCLSDHYELVVAENGEEGIRQAIDMIPDAVVSDVMMPGADGFEVCAYLKEDQRTSHIPIILLTAKADVDARLTGLSTGADAYLSKPVHKKELLIRLETLLKNQKKILAYFSKRFENGFTTTSMIPDDEDKISPREKAFVDKVRSIVEENYGDENFSLEELCAKLGMSRSQLYRKMKPLLDTPPSHFIRTYRLEKAKYFLETTDLNVSEVAWKTGYKDVAHFSKSFQEEFGYSPSEVSK